MSEARERPAQCLLRGKQKDLDLCARLGGLLGSNSESFDGFSSANSVCSVDRSHQNSVCEQDPSIPHVIVFLHVFFPQQNCVS